MLQELFNFFNQGWVGSLIGVVGVLIGAIGIFSYKISKSRAKPSFQKSSLRLLGRDEDNLPEDVTVLFKGQEVDRLTKTQLIIWNNGTEVLNGEDIVSDDPLRIAFTEGTNILSYKILKTTRDVNKFSIKKDEDKPSQLFISFSYLDPSDGITLELLHDSSERYPNILGTIKGIPKGFDDLGRVILNFVPAKNTKAKNPLLFLSRKPKLVLSVAILLGLSMVLLGFLPQETRDIILSNNVDDSFDQSIVFIIAGILYTAMRLSLLWLRRKRYPKLLEIEEDES